MRKEVNYDILLDENINTTQEKIHNVKYYNLIMKKEKQDNNNQYVTSKILVKNIKLAKKTLIRELFYHFDDLFDHYPHNFIVNSNNEIVDFVILDELLDHWEKLKFILVYAYNDYLQELLNLFQVFDYYLTKEGLIKYFQMKQFYHFLFSNNYNNKIGVYEVKRYYETYFDDIYIPILLTKNVLIKEEKLQINFQGKIQAVHFDFMNYLSKIKKTFDIDTTREDIIFNCKGSCIYDLKTNILLSYEEISNINILSYKHNNSYKINRVM